MIGYAPEQAAALAGLPAGDGDPERALDFLADPEASLRLIMNGGAIAGRTGLKFSPWLSDASGAAERRLWQRSVGLGK